MYISCRFCLWDVAVLLSDCKMRSEKFPHSGHGSSMPDAAACDTSGPDECDCDLEPDASKHNRTRHDVSGNRAGRGKAGYQALNEGRDVEFRQLTQVKMRKVQAGVA